VRAGVVVGTCASVGKAGGKNEISMAHIVERFMNVRSKMTFDTHCSNFGLDELNPAKVAGMV
jgi:hypothetical protein